MDKLLAHRWLNYWPSNVHKSCTKCPVTTLRKHYKTRHFGPTSANTTQNQPKFTHHSVHLLRKKNHAGARWTNYWHSLFVLVVQVLLLDSFISFSSCLSSSFFFFVFFSSLLSCSFFLPLPLFFYTSFFSIVSLFCSLFLFFFSSCVALLVLFLIFLLFFFFALPHLPSCSLSLSLSSFSCFFGLEAKQAKERRKE